MDSFRIIWIDSKFLSFFFFFHMKTSKKKATKNYFTSQTRCFIHHSRFKWSIASSEINVAGTSLFSIDSPFQLVASVQLYKPPVNFDGGKNVFTATKRPPVLHRSVCELFRLFVVRTRNHKTEIFTSSPLSFFPPKSISIDPISTPFSIDLSTDHRIIFISLFSTLFIRASARVLIENLRYWSLTIWDRSDRSSSSSCFEIYILRDHSNNWRRESWIVTIGIEVFAEKLFIERDRCNFNSWLKGKIKKWICYF